MAATPSAPPVYTGNALSGYERRRLGRKCEKYDFDRFRPLQGSGYFLGEKERIGQMEVACKFLFQKSHWGVLTPYQNPGGILYLDLVFTEPPGFRLRGATIILTLDEHDEDLRRRYSNIQNSVPVQIIEHGPQHLVGQMKTMEKIRVRRFIPSLKAGAFAELGGMGQISQERGIRESQWRFSSQTMPDRSGRPTTLVWDLAESDLDRQPKHTNTFHTALAFEHDGQPFLIRAEVNGLLENTASNLAYKMKKKLKKFRFPRKPQEVITLVNFKGRSNPWRQPLDEIAESLPEAMVEANKTSVPLVQTAQTTQAQVGVFDGALTIQAEDEPSYEAMTSEGTGDLQELQELTHIRDTVLALMALLQTGSTRRGLGEAYTRLEPLR